MPTTAPSPSLATTVDQLLFAATGDHHHSNSSQSAQPQHQSPHHQSPHHQSPHQDWSPVLTRLLRRPGRIERGPWRAEAMIRVPIAYAIGSIAAFWTVQRVVGFWG